jgi:ligand-binding sensor domain-containing protein
MKPFLIRKRLLLFSLTIFLCCGLETFAQKEKLVYEQLSVEQGLSFNLVTDILQDKKGFMWFATADGLNRYDGYNFNVFKPNPLGTNSLIASYINSIFVDSYGIIWLNSVRYLHKFNEANGTFTRMLQGMWLTSMCEDTSNSSNAGMWFTTYGQGLHWWGRTQNKFVHYKSIPGNLNSLGSDSILCASVDRSSILWIGTSRGVNSFDVSRKNIKQYSNGPDFPVYTIIEDPNPDKECIWMGTAKGLYCYDKRTNQFHNFKNPFASKKNPEDNDVRTLYFDSKRILWVGMIGGIAGFEVSERKYFTYNNEIQSSPWAYLTKAWLIQEDPTGKIWALAHGGTSFHPLLKFDSKLKRFVQYPTLPESPLLSYSMYIDKL